jgi:hypothetical protein
VVLEQVGKDLLQVAEITSTPMSAVALKSMHFGASTSLRARDRGRAVGSGKTAYS